ncbi:MAG: ABC transporter substrate-binding protein, partial [Chloroflexota bacterium]|nr:ABC transporter substrate-binding protein [Chloroflexota bacterium]
MLRGQLDAAALEQALADGKRLTIDEAVALALTTGGGWRTARRTPAGQPRPGPARGPLGSTRGATDVAHPTATRSAAGLVAASASHDHPSGMHGRWVVLAILATVVACTAPSTSESPAPSSGEAADRLVIGVAYPSSYEYFVLLSNLAIQPQVPSLSRLAHSSLYRYDDSLAPVPDLAAEPCVVGEDQVTITCRLKEAEFGNGTPVTADDVVYTFEVGRRSNCAFTSGLTCLETLESVTAVDERTVEFRLTQPDASFLTLALALIFIDSQAVVEAAYAPIADRAGELDPEELRAMTGRIDEAVSGDQAGCETLVGEVDELFGTIGTDPIPRRYFEFGPDGAFDPCAYVFFAGQRITAIAASLETTGLDAIAAAYSALPFNWEPVGAGPWRFRELADARSMVFEANPGYHGEQPATPEIEFRVYATEAETTDAIRSGEIHWLTGLGTDVYGELRDDPRVVIAEFDGPAFSFLAFNLREGRLFADRNLRTALELCIDKPATVDAASEDEGAVIYSPIEPA